MLIKKTTAKTVKKNTTEAMNNFQRSASENKFIRVMLFISVLLNAFTYNKADQLEKKQTTVIVPYGAKSSDMLITGESASSSYIRKIARLIVNDYGSVSKATVEQKFADLLSLTWPDRVEALRKKLNERAKYFQQFNSLSQGMELSTDQPMTIIENPADAKYETNAQNRYRFTFSVEQRKIIGDIARPSESLKMSIDYTIADGQFWLLDIE